MQFYDKSERGPVKILRSARDDIVCTCICVILIGVAVWLHARSARRWGSLGSCPKGWFSGTRVRFSMGSCPKRVVFRYGGPVFYGVVPEKGGFQARYRLHSALLSPSVQSEEGYLQRCGNIQFNFAAPQQQLELYGKNQLRCGKSNQNLSTPLV